MGVVVVARQSLCLKKFGRASSGLTECTLDLGLVAFDGCTRKV